MFGSIRRNQRFSGGSRVVLAALAVAALAAARTDGWAGATFGLGQEPLLTSTSEDSDYKLGALDKVRVKVFEWRPARDEIFAWSALNADYTVGPTGMVALPLIGEIHAAGLGTAQLANEIAARLQQRMGLASPPDTVVDIASYRPIYIVGRVEKPGEYAFRPGLTVLQALSIGGGLTRSATDHVRYEREMVTTVGDMQLLNVERQALLAHRARLRAELDSKATVDTPADKGGVSSSAIEQEKLVFSLRQNTRATQLAALQQLKTYLASEVKSLNQQIEAQGRERAVMTTELNQITDLRKKGLATAPRQFALERGAAQLDGESLRLQGSVLRASQELSKTDLSILELENKRSDEIANDLMQTEIKLRQLDEKQATTNALLENTEAADLSLPRHGQVAKTHFVVVRNTSGVTSELEATEATLVLPGDTIKVELPTDSEPAINAVVAPRPVRPDPLKGLSRASLDVPTAGPTTER